MLAGLVVVAAISFLYVGKKASSWEEGAYVFDSNVFPAYKEQLRAFFHVHPAILKAKGDVVTLYERLKKEAETLPSTPEKNRAEHEEFVEKLRALAALRLTQEVMPEAKPFDAFIRWMFLEADLRKAQAAFLYKEIPPPEAPLKEYVVSAVESLKKNPRFSDSDWADDKDSLSSGNLPSMQFTLTEPHPLTVFRMGEPLMESPLLPAWLAYPTVTPEFYLFLKLQKGHFYVNLMKREGVEKKSSQVLEQLTETVPGFHLVTLDSNSPFFWQDEAYYPELMEGEAFASLFLENMKKKEGLYFWPSELRNEGWNNELASIIDKTKKTYFPQAASLSREERRIVIDLVYLEVIDALVKRWKPSSLNITCKQGVDRGPALMTLWMLKHLSPPPAETAALLLAPPLLIRGRASHLSRIERWVKTLPFVYRT